MTENRYEELEKKIQEKFVVRNFTLQLEIETIFFRSDIQSKSIKLRAKGFLKKPFSDLEQILENYWPIFS